jgi:hypothetical protein
LVCQTVRVALIDILSSEQHSFSQAHLNVIKPDATRFGRHLQCSNSQSLTSGENVACNEIEWWEMKYKWYRVSSRGLSGNVFFRPPSPGAQTTSENNPSIAHDCFTAWEPRESPCEFHWRSIHTIDVPM